MSQNPGFHGLWDHVIWCLREALCTLVRTKLDCQILSVRSFVRSCVRPENNHFLGRGYEGGTHPPAYR